jgi:hypothetical protein
MVIAMNETLSRDVARVDHLPPTLRSAELWMACQGLSRTPEIAVVEASPWVRPEPPPPSSDRAPHSAWPEPSSSSSGRSLLSLVAREVASTLFEMAFAPRRPRPFWS